jgi:hypothetical protein
VSERFHEETSHERFETAVFCRFFTAITVLFNGSTEDEPQCWDPPFAHLQPNGSVRVGDIETDNR